MSYSHSHPIGIFDSGFGGLTIFHSLQRSLPDYDYLYLGDNARAPYGEKTFDQIHSFTWQAVQKLFSSGCPLVILACNTASARALHLIQKQDLPLFLSNQQKPSLDSSLQPLKNVLGVIRPTVEIIDQFTHTHHVGILGTPATIASQAYPKEIAKFFPDISVTAHACPLWVNLVENNQTHSPKALQIIQSDIQQLLALDSQIDAIILGCTHYPLLISQIRQCLSPDIQIISQNDYLATSLISYLTRHPEITTQITTSHTQNFLTTGDQQKFDLIAGHFLHQSITSQTIQLP